jgi:ankyrin repeat protein
MTTDRGFVTRVRPWIAVGVLLAVLGAAQAQPTEPGSTGFRMGRSATTAAALALKNTQPQTLERAVLTQDREAAHVLLEAGADPNARTSGNQEPLIVAAAMQGDPVIADDLIAHGANVNAAGETGSALVWAARQGNLEAVRTLLARGANVNYRAPDGGTALHSTLGDGNDVRIAALLLDNGADLEARKSGMTPLLMASLFGRVEWVRLFIQRGAQVNARNESGQTPLAVSAAFGREPHVERLLKDAGAR